MIVKDVIELADAECTIAVIGPSGRFIADAGERLLKNFPALADIEVTGLRAMSLPGSPAGRIEINVAEL